MSEIAPTTTPETATEIELIRNQSVVKEVKEEDTPMYKNPRQEMMGFILNPKGLAEFERKLSRTLTGSTETDIFVPIFEEVVKDNVFQPQQEDRLKLLVMYADMKTLQKGSMVRNTLMLQIFTK